MIKLLLLFLAAGLMAHSATASYHVLVADQKAERTNTEDSFHSHFRSRRSLTDPDEILNNLIDADGSGSGDGDSMVTGREQTFQFYVKNNDTENSASMHLSELMPGNAILTEFVINNEAQTYRYNDINVKDKEQAEREYEESAKAGMSTVMVGNVQSTNHRCSDCRSEDFDGQAVSAVINVAPGDVLSISLSYVVPISSAIVESGKDLYRTDVTILMEESAKQMETVIMSPNYPESYPNNADVTYLIQAPLGKMSVSASLLSFDSESCCDHLYIYDGETDTSPILAVVSGDTFSTDPIVTSGSSMLVKFQTDFMVNSGGFAMQLSAVEEDVPPSKLPVNEAYYINQNNGVVETPGYPKSYPPSSILTWNITSDPDTILYVEIYDINILSQETLQIFDGISGNLLEALTESEQTTYRKISAPGNKVLIVFTSIQRIVFRRGFYAEFNSNLPQTLCLSNIDLGSGDDDWNVLTSPNYPNNYGNNADCLWVISVPGTNRVRIEIETLNLESSFDTLQIFNTNGTEESSIMGTLSGTGGKSIEYVSTSNVMTIYFTSDESVTDSGFQVKYKLYHVEKSCSSSPPTLDWPSGLLTNTYWPSFNYYDNDCQWLLSVTPGKIVEVQVEYYYGYDSRLTFYDGDSIAEDVLWSFSGSLNYPSSIEFRSSINQMLVTLKIDSYYSYDSVRYSFTYKEANEVPICKEQELLTTSPGVIASPLYPRYYPNNTNCQWLIQANEGSYAVLKIETIRLNDEDQVSFYSDGTGVSPLVQCNYYSCYDGQMIVSNSNTMHITANTYSSNGFFKFVYSFTSDSESLIEEKDDYSGYAYSPNYPLDYPNSFNYVYSISVASDHIQFYFESFETESCCDYLYMYDGSSTSSPRIATLSGSYNGFLGETSGTSLTMRFTTDGSVTEIGFKMNYCSSSHCNYNNVLTPATANSYMYVDDLYAEKYFSSPGATGNYPNNEDFYWFIECGSALGTYYRFYRLDIDSSDFVKLYENFGTDSNQLRVTFSGVNYFYSTNGIDVYSKRSTVWFHSDSDFTGQGFYVLYECYS